MTVLTRSQWSARQDAHHRRVDLWTEGHRHRAARGQEHPVEDFLFTYYSHRPSRLRRWSPGAGVSLTDFPGAQPWLDHPPDRVARSASWIAQLLDRTASRPPQFGCFGLHEWAMVYREEPRHRAWPLRLGDKGTAAVVESLPLRCSHHDAFRFFTPSARPLNLLQPRREDQADLEQGGCLHANMDLYKWSYKLVPWVASEIVADCFDLARRVRTLDMRASPYDFSALGLTPVEVDTEQGRAEYVQHQRAFAHEAVLLRARVSDAARLLV
ncbi:MAG: hypothetical protein JWM02_223 [Frankiales bacterium]|nr:hypothetical protein [Frankiales bacterium]